MKPFNPGEILSNRYTIESLVERTHMAVVYRAKDKRTSQTVAIKTPLPEFLERSTTRERFQKEVAAYEKLPRHPHLIELRDSGTHDGCPYVVLPWLEDIRPLQSIVHGPMEEAEVVRILTPIADALRHAHDHGVCHLDISHRNVVFQGDNRDPILIDFGLSVVAEEFATMTQPDRPIGTPGFTPPEVLRQVRQRNTVRQDLWGLGALAFFMLAGQTPHPDARRDDHLRTLQNARIDVSPVTKPLRALILRMLEAEPHHRPASMDEVVDALKGLPSKRLNREAWVFLGILLGLGATVMVGPYRGQLV